MVPWKKITGAAHLGLEESGLSGAIELQSVEADPSVRVAHKREVDECVLGSVSTARSCNR